MATLSVNPQFLARHMGDYGRDKSSWGLARCFRKKDKVEIDGRRISLLEAKEGLARQILELAKKGASFATLADSMERALENAKAYRTQLSKTSTKEKELSRDTYEDRYTTETTVNKRITTTISYEKPGRFEKGIKAAARALKEALLETGRSENSPDVQRLNRVIDFDIEIEPLITEEEITETVSGY